MRLRAGLLWIACAAFVAYLSFVPFRFQPLGFEEALARFAQIRYLDLGAGSRADWVANILMYVPLGWLAAAFFVPHPRGRFDPAALIPSLVLGAAWATAVEFGQVYFAGRTVSINDIVAEAIGTLVGAWLWSAFGTRGREWWGTLLLGGRATANAALAGYLLAYLVLSFSPFDLIIGADELASKLASGLNGWWMAPVSCGRTPCSLKLLVEVLAVLPFGWWWASRRRAANGTVLSAAVLGALLGMLIELAQLLLVSGTSQGASILSRAAGVAAGAWLHSRRQFVAGINWVQWGPILVLAGFLPYLAAVAYVAGWFGGGWLGLEAGLARADEIRWMPFFYQYFTTEQALIRSTLVHLALYAPVGVAVWLWGKRRGSVSTWIAALLAALIATAAETGNLFLQGKHPDYTDVLIAIVAAWTTATLLRWMSAANPGAAPAPAGGLPARATPSGQQGLMAAAPIARSPLTADGRPAITALDVLSRGTPASWSGRAAGIVAAAIVAVSLWRFPLWQVPLAVGLTAYAWLLTRSPLAYLLVVPAALPVLDLAPLSGRFFWDEFDLLLATTLAVRLLMSMPEPVVRLRLPRTGLTLLWMSLLASAVVALWPLMRPDANAFTSYLSPYNALRIGKGYLWGGVLLWLVWRDAAANRDVVSRLVSGLALGLLAAILGVFWERLLFVGLTDLGAWFRAAGMVSATHTGGAYLEALLVILTPFAMAKAVTARGAILGALWFGLVLLGAAAVLMTLSRAAAASWLIVVIAFGGLWWLGQHRRVAGEPRRSRRWIASASIVLLVATAALMAQSTYLTQRMAMSGADFPVRLAHWRSAVGLMRDDPLSLVFGMGIGSFPREFYLAEAGAQKLPAYRLDREPPGGPAFLALVGGGGMYLDQRVDAPAGPGLMVRGRVRSSRDGAELALALCEKSFLTSVHCDWAAVRASTDWQAFEVRLNLSDARRTHAGPRAPASFSLSNRTFGTRLEITGLSVMDGSSELLVNGSFEHGLDRWLMYSDQHLAWRVKNTWLQVVFEQGLLGALAWLMLIVALLRIGARRIDEAPVAAALASTGGLLAIGCFDTLFDAPRLVELTALVFGLVLVPRSFVGPASPVATSLRPPAATPAPPFAPPAPAPE